ncbi:winged helix DNA-binding domain-containing protein [Actinoplanes sp. NPDC023714]|uniref:winged helix DNA-binding domain-containing protein n=1 Tax=Actinoplanes sp. NPDC023714 TaxID=3154322 RepID=UPI0033F27122
MRVLSRRELNRTYLVRQLLTGQNTRTPAEVTAHLVALQGQESDSPHLSLRARITGFRPEDLGDLLHDRTVVRSALLRGTQHLCTAEDFRWLRPTLQPSLDRFAGRGGRLTGLDQGALVEAAGEILAAGPVGRPELTRRLVARFPGVDAEWLKLVVHLRLALLHPPPAGMWRHRGRVACVLAEDWIGAPLADGPSPETLVLRYLAAFGPASVKDIQVWSGLTRLRGVVAGLRGRLRVFRDEAGIDLYDLPDAPLADDDVPAPVVFLPEFDNALLGHADRDRIIHPGDRPLVTPGWSIVRPTVLVDGFAEGTWLVDGSALHITPFRPLSAKDRAAVEVEGERLLGFLNVGEKPEIHWGSEQPDVRFPNKPRRALRAADTEGPLPGGTE